MAQIGRYEFELLRGAAAGERSMWERLRIDEVPRAVLAAIAVLALVAVLLGAVLLVRVASPAGEELVRPAADSGVSELSAQNAQEGGGTDAAPQVEVVETPGLVVHIVGAVAMPGVYELDATARVVDAVEAAGGAADWADLSQINLAEHLVDGAKVTIPAYGEMLSAPVSAVEAPGMGADVGSGTPVVNINTASAEELQQLVGVGESTAAAIVRDREANGPFASPEDLMRVSGIGAKKFENMRSQVVV